MTQKYSRFWCFRLLVVVFFLFFGLKLNQSDSGVCVCFQQTIEIELAQVEEGLCDNNGIRDEIFKKVIGDDKYGYVKTYSMGVKVPRSSSKRCALQEEHAKRVKIEEQY